MPALLTRTSSLPNCPVVAATTAAQLSSLVTSSGSNRAAAPIASATCRPSCSSTSAITTFAPSRANKRAVAAPMPDAAPEMTATLPASLIAVLPFCSHRRMVTPAITSAQSKERPYRSGVFSSVRDRYNCVYACALSHVALPFCTQSADRAQGEEPRFYVEGREDLGKAAGIPGAQPGGRGAGSDRTRRNGARRYGSDHRISR